MRDLAVSALVIGCLPTCFRRPFIGLLMFTLLAYMRVQDLAWGFARFQRWSYYVAIVTLAGFVLAGGKKKFMLNDARNWVMILLCLFVGVSVVMSSQVEGMADAKRYIEYLKIIGVALFTTGVVKNRDYLRVLVWVIALSFGFFGVKNGIAGILSGGSMVIIEGPGGMLADNNDFALALTMGVPLLFHLGWAENRKLIRRTVVAMVPLTMITIAATHSRGAFLALTSAILVLVWRSRNRVAGFAVLFLVAVTAVLAAPESYKERISTIGSYEEDASARGRLDAWRIAGNMIRANPMWGVGFDKFTQNYRNYDVSFGGAPAGRPNSGVHVAHNSYLQIWAECGTPAFVCYLLLLFLSYWDIWRTRKMATQRYHASWILSYCTMFEASMTAFLVGSVFLNRAQFDLFYHFVAVITVFGVFARREMEDLHAYPVIPKEAGKRGVLAAMRTRGLGRPGGRDGFGPRKRKSGFDRDPALGGV